MSNHTPGPWRWEVNMESKILHLVGGKPQFDLTILEPTRWGMGSATLMLRDTAHDGMNIMHKLHERRDWVSPFPGREHHANWCASVKHPDMQLIEAAPDLLSLLQDAVDSFGPHLEGSDDEWLIFARAAIAKATGSSHGEI